MIQTNPSDGVAHPRSHSIRDVYGDPCYRARPDLYPLKARCDTCNADIRCEDGTADWYHTHSRSGACGARIARQIDMTWIGLVAVADGTDAHLRMFVDGRWRPYAAICVVCADRGIAEGFELSEPGQGVIEGLMESASGRWQPEDGAECMLHVGMWGAPLIWSAARQQYWIDGDQIREREISGRWVDTLPTHDHRPLVASRAHPAADLCSCGMIQDPETGAWGASR